MKRPYMQPLSQGQFADLASGRPRKFRPSVAVSQSGASSDTASRLLQPVLFLNVLIRRVPVA
eukprot:201489-Alexandrium_andersonii.AAC.1